MLTYIVLASFTEQGIRSIKETTQRAEAARETATRFEIRRPILMRDAGAEHAPHPPLG